MKKIAIIFAALILSSPALAQAPQQAPNEELDVAMQLLNERTGQVIKLASEVQKLSKQLQAAQAELAKAKAKTPPPPAKP